MPHETSLPEFEQGRALGLRASGIEIKEIFTKRPYKYN